MYNEIEQNILEDQYATKDLYFAAFLSIKGLKVEKLEKFGSSRGRNTPVYFIFGDRFRCEELEGLFWSGTDDEIFCNIKDFTSAVRDLRSRAFSVNRTLQRTQERY